MRLWSIYLNDQLALMVAAQVLSRRAARSNKASDLGTFLADLASELETDISALHVVMDELGVASSRVKIPAVRIGVRLGRLKWNGRIIRYSPLSRVVELEALCLLAAARRRFWTSLGDADLRLPNEVVPPALAEHSAGQLDRLEELHRESVHALPRPGAP